MALSRAVPTPTLDDRNISDRLVAQCGRAHEIAMLLRETLLRLRGAVPEAVGDDSNVKPAQPNVMDAIASLESFHAEVDRYANELRRLI